MFEELDPSALLAVVEQSHRDESMLVARRLSAIAELLARRIGEAQEDDPDPGYSMISGFARTTAEVSAALNHSPMGASHLVGCAETLDARLPKVAALLASGETDWRTVQVIITRTEFVRHDLIAQLDGSLADRISRWQCWSRRRIINAVDAAVRAIDPDAARERRVNSDTDRHITITNRPDGMAQLRGTLSVTAAAAFDARLSELAKAVCANDPRTIVRRRADENRTALTEGRALTCQCSHPDCPNRNGAESVPSGGARTVINVIASHDTLTGDSDQPGYLAGYGVIDADQVRELAESATLRMVDCPTVSPEAALRYQPTTALARWIRCRDLTCRFPGCDRRAEHCDLDHTVAFNHADPHTGGMTVPGNLKCLCRFHHLLKTFHPGWRDEQLPDGAVIWTSPTGRVYRTIPGGVELFPDLRPACVPPKRRRRNHNRERAARIARARNNSRTQRPVNAEQRRINRARKQEIADRKWRNHMRKMLVLFKGGEPSTSLYCRWVNDPFEPEDLPPDWEPPPAPPPLPDDPPF